MRKYVISSKRKLGTATASSAKEALDQYCANHPDDDTGYQRGGLLIDADTHGRVWASVVTDAGRLRATRQPVREV